MLSGMRIDSSCNSGLAGRTTDANRTLPSLAQVSLTRVPPAAERSDSTRPRCRALTSGRAFLSEMGLLTPDLVIVKLEETIKTI